MKCSVFHLKSVFSVLFSQNKITKRYSTTYSYTNIYLELSLHISFITIHTVNMTVYTGDNLKTMDGAKI